MEVTRDMLQFKYSWEAVEGDNPRIIGAPDSSRFSREEGYEVLSMIQSVVDELSLTKKRDVHALEDIIKNFLHGSIQRKDRVFSMLVSSMKGRIDSENRIKENVEVKEVRNFRKILKEEG